MPGWSDLGSAFNTLREIDVSGIREDAERAPAIICFGARALFDAASRLLLTTGSRRYGPVGTNPLFFQALPSGEPEEALRRADMLLVLLDGREPLSRSQAQGLERLSRLGVPTTIVIWYAELPADAAAAVRPAFAHAHIVALPDPEHPEAAGKLADAIVERLPGELQIAAARRLPGLRPTVARQLVSSVSFSNASYALASALPEQIPMLNLPFAAADMLVLTKNQALLVYKLALAHGAPPEFQARIREVLPVIGGAYIWRQLARALVGLIPIWGIVPKVAIAYAGTYTTGVAAWRWFADSELLSGARLKAISDEALRIGRARADELIATARAGGMKVPGLFRRLSGRVRAMLPSRKKEREKS